MIDFFLEKVNFENLVLRDYKVLVVKKKCFGEINVVDSFFELFK